MDFFELFESLVDDILFVLWWMIPVKLFNLDLNWLKRLSYKRVVIMWVVVFIIGVAVKAAGAMK